MAEVGVISLFVVWFFLSIAYVFKPNSLGKLGKWLHRFGWLNEWSMFTSLSDHKDSYRIVYRDFNKEEDPIHWKLVESNQINSIPILVNPNFKFNFFLAKCLKKMNAAKRLNKYEPINAAVFDYLCAVLMQLPKSNNLKYRRINIEKYCDGKKVDDYLHSKTFELR